MTWARGRTAIKSEVCYTGHVLSERVQQARHIKHRLWTVNCTLWTCLMSTIEVVDNIPFFKRHYFNENCWANQSFTVILFISKSKFKTWVPWMYFQKVTVKCKLLICYLAQYSVSVFTSESVDETLKRWKLLSTIPLWYKPQMFNRWITLPTG